jgi:hypothetical protein
MSFRQRLTVMFFLLSIARAIYGASRYYSQLLIVFVVEHTLMQRLPGGSDPALLRHRVETLLAASPSQDIKMERLLNLSMHLEKIQVLTPGELDELLSKDGAGAGQGPTPD